MYPSGDDGFVRAETLQQAVALIGQARSPLRRGPLNNSGREKGRCMTPSRHQLGNIREGRTYILVE